MFGRRMIRVVGFMAALPLVWGVEVRGQNIALMSEDGTEIPDESVPDKWNLTDFPDTKVGEQVTHTFRLRNTDTQTTLITGMSYFIAGDNPGDFPTVPGASQIPPGSEVLVTITFAPTVLGERSARITINSNSPATEAAYAFHVKGNGVAATPVSPINLSAELLTPPKAKYVKKGSLTRIKAKIAISNLGNALFEGGVVSIYESHTGMLDAASDLIEVQPLAALPAFDPAKKLKRRKMRINVDSENNVSGQLFIRVIPQKPSSTDADYSDNQVGGEYVVTVP